MHEKTWEIHDKADVFWVSSDWDMPPSIVR
jgi:hypothetical protein